MWIMTGRSLQLVSCSTSACQRHLLSLVRISRGERMAATEGRKAGSATAAKGTPDKADGKGAAQTGTGAATDASSPSSGFGGSGIGADVLAVLLIGTLVSNILGARHWRQTMARASAQARERMEAERLYREAQRRAQEKNGYKGARQGEQQQRENPGDSYGTSEVRDHLDALGIKDLRAPEKEVKAAYRERVLRLHPDRHGDSSAAKKILNEEEFKRVAQAYSWLQRNHFRPGRFN